MWRRRGRIMMTTYCWIAVIVASIAASPTRASGQNVLPSPDADRPVAASADPQQTAAAGEEGKKPTRGFFSALAHNLGDDIHHLPRWNSAYWLAGGGALALAVHPADRKINSHLVGH